MFRNNNDQYQLNDKMSFACQLALKSNLKHCFCRRFFLTSDEKSPKTMKMNKKIEIGQKGYFNKFSGAPSTQKLIEIHNIKQRKYFGE